MKKNPENLRLSASQNGFTPLKNFIDKDSCKVMNKHFKGIKLSSILNSLTGFTLIEMMIAMAITLFVMSGVYEVFTSQQKAYGIQNQVAEMQQNARVAMDMMTREIRMAGFIAESWTGVTTPNIDVSVGGSATDASADDIEEANANDITFEGDIDDDGNTDTVRYSLDATDNELGREVWTWDDAAPGWNVSSSGKQPVAENITSLTFEYYNSSGAQLSSVPLSSNDRSSVRLIKISITARTARKDSGFTNSDGTSGGYRTRILTAYVRPRNLGL